MTHKRTKYEREHPDKFEMKNENLEPQYNFCYTGYSHTFLFRMPHVPCRYIQRVRKDVHRNLREDADICMLLAHVLEETEIPKIKIGEEHDILIDLHIHPERADKTPIHFGEFYIPLKRNKKGYLVVPTILNKDQRDDYVKRRIEEDEPRSKTKRNKR
jgi:hypothetical protein